MPLETETPTAAELCAAFEDEYRRLFGRIIPGGDIEVLSWQLRLSRQNWQVEEPPAAPTPLDVKATDNRPVFELRMDTHVNHSVFRREELQPGAQFGGPAIIVEDETATIVPAILIVSNWVWISLVWEVLED